MRSHKEHNYTLTSGYNSFSRSLSVKIPEVKFITGATILVVVEEGRGFDTVGGVDEMIACTGFGSR